MDCGCKMDAWFNTGKEEEMKVTEIPEPVIVDNKESVKYHIVGFDPYLNHNPIYAIEKICTPVIRFEAIDTVVSELEKPTPTLEQSDDKRLFFSAYLQGKRDQIYWATKWEELKPIGKYRIMKQFLSWYKTLKLKEIGE